jgi:hypothetical protein
MQKRAGKGFAHDRAGRADPPSGARCRLRPLPAGRSAGSGAATDQGEQLRLFAADISRRLERAAPLVAVVSGAARAEPELAELLMGLHAERRRNLRMLVDALAAASF